MAKKVKFPLNMGNEVYVRTLDELKENYNSEKVTEYFLDGRLLTWLEDRYFDDEAEQVRELMEQDDKNNLAAKLGKIFGVEIQKDVDVENLEIRGEKLEKLRNITSDDNILNSADLVAFSQEELGDLLDNGAEVIYLCGEKFRIPRSVENVRYIGVNKPTVTISGKGEIDLEASGIVFENCEFPNDTMKRFSGKYKYNKIASKILKANVNGSNEEHEGVLAVHETFGYNQDMTKLMMTDMSTSNYLDLVNNWTAAMTGDTKKKKVTEIILCPPSNDCCYNFSVDSINDVVEIFSKQYEKVLEYIGRHPTVSDRFDSNKINQIIGSGAVYVINQHSFEAAFEEQAVNGDLVSKYIDGMANIFDNPVVSGALSACSSVLSKAIVPTNDSVSVIDNGGIKYCIPPISCQINNAPKWKITIKIAAESYSEFIDKFTVPLVYFKEKKDEILGMQERLDLARSRLESASSSEDFVDLRWIKTAKTKSIKKYEEYKMQPLILVNMKALFECIELKFTDKSGSLQKSAVGTCAGFFSVEFE